MLDRSAFHPGGGGQVSDTGWLDHAAGTVDVTGIDHVDDVLWHVLADDILELSGPVVLRADHGGGRVAQLHTDSHVLNALVYFPGTLVTGAQINDDGTGRMDFDLSEVDNDVLRALDAGVNDVIGSGVEVRSVYVDAGGAATVAGLVRSLSVAPPPTPDGTLRVIDIDGVDRQACGGTHLSNTSLGRSASRRSRTRASATGASASCSIELDCRPAARAVAGTSRPITHVGSAIDACTASTSPAAQTTTMPMPMFSVRYSSSPSRRVSSRTSWNTVAPATNPSRCWRPRPRATPRTFSSRPPPVMWASALIRPLATASPSTPEVVPMGLEQRRAEGRSKPARATSIGAQSKTRRNSRPLVWGPLDATPTSMSPTATSARQQGCSLGNADDAGDVERARRIDARHLGRLAAEQGASGRFTRLGHAGYNVSDNVSVQRSQPRSRGRRADGHPARGCPRCSG